jgi:DNA-binding beta-propeller fold protein YncE
MMSLRTSIHLAPRALVLAIASVTALEAQSRSVPPVRRPQPSQKAAPPSAAKPTATYWVYVGAESADLVHRIRFGPDGAAVEKTFGAGEMAAETEGPHGLQISHDGKYLHMTTGHGQPDGKYWKYQLGPDTLVGEPILLGNFPASIDVSADGLYAFAVNFNLHGEMVPSSVSVVYTPTNTEVAQVTTCVMPHGSRLDVAGARQYSTCMMDDQLVEVDARAFKVSGRFSLAKGKEGPLPLDSPHAGHDMSAVGATPMKMPPASCSPTWAQPATREGAVFVACNKSDEILEIDTKSWKVVRRLTTGRGPYNLAVSPDGKLLVATLKQGNAVQVFDLESGRAVMKEATSTTLAHGVTISSDSRYAFVSAEGVGAEPGKVDVFDLRAMRKVGSVDVGQQASGITFWKMEGK